MLFPLNLLSHRPLIWWLLCSKITLKSWFLSPKDSGKLWNLHIIKNGHMFNEQEWLEMMTIISLRCHGRQTKLCLEQGGEALLLTRPGLLWSWGPPHHSSRAQLEWERDHSPGESGWCPPIPPTPTPIESVCSLNQPLGSPTTLEPLLLRGWAWRTLFPQTEPWFSSKFRSTA